MSGPIIAVSLSLSLGRAVDGGHFGPIILLAAGLTLTVIGLRLMRLPPIYRWLAEPIAENPHVALFIFLGLVLGGAALVVLIAAVFGVPM